MKTIITMITQKIEIPHPMYVTMESAVDSDGESCQGINNTGGIVIILNFSSLLIQYVTNGMVRLHTYLHYGLHDLVLVIITYLANCLQSLT